MPAETGLKERFHGENGGKAGLEGASTARKPPPGELRKAQAVFFHGGVAGRESWNSRTSFSA